MTRNEFKKLTENPVLLDGAIGSNLIVAGMLQSQQAAPHRNTSAH